MKEKKQLVIGIDIDDTITDTTSMIKKCFKESENDELINNMEDIIRGYYVSESSVNFFKGLSKMFIDGIKIKKGVKEVIKKIHDDGHKIIFITARNDNYFGDAYSICYEYLIKNGIVFDKLLIGSTYKIEDCKKEKIDILIDDSCDIINNALDNGIDGILVNSSLNIDKECKANRFDDWYSIYNYIENKYNI